MMPTAARLVAALALAATGFLASRALIPALPEGTPAFWLGPVNAAIGLILGWRFLGTRAGQGVVAAVQTGLMSAALLLVWALAVWSIREMLDRSIHLRYHGLEEALLAVGDIAGELAVVSFTVPVWGVLIVGGIASGLLAEIARRYWP